MSSKKIYSKKDYDASDYRAKVLASRFMMRNGAFTIAEPIHEQKEAYKEYDIIMIRKSDGKKIKIEAEHKKCWIKRGKWQGYESVDVPYRKSESKADTFIMSNLSWDTIAVVPMKAILASKTSCKDTKCSDGEKFFNVDIKEFRFFKATSKDRTKWVEIDKYGKK